MIYLQNKNLLRSCKKTTKTGGHLAILVAMLTIITVKIHEATKFGSWKKNWLIKPPSPTKPDVNLNYISAIAMLINDNWCNDIVTFPELNAVRQGLNDTAQIISKNREHMITSSNGNIFHVTGPLWWESTGYQWITLIKALMFCFDVFFDLRLDKRLRKQSRLQWFETPLCTLWRHCNKLYPLDYCFLLYSSLSELETNYQS